MRPFVPIICIISVLSCQSPKTSGHESRFARAKEIHKDVITIDTHVDIEVKNFTDNLNYTSNLGTQVNLDDEQLDKIRDNGGVVQTVAFDAYLNSEKAGKRASYMAALYRKVADSLGVSRNETSVGDQPKVAQLETFLENYPQVKKIAREWSENDVNAPPAVDVSDLADHIDYMVTRIGIDHVGISSDFDGGGGIEGWMDASETFNVTLELVERGYSEKEISKLWGGNLLRVMDEVQKAASQVQNL